MELSKEFIEKLSVKLLRYATTLTKQEATAQDLCWEVIGKIWESKNLPDDINVEFYAMRSVKNLFLNNEKINKRMISDQNSEGNSIYESTGAPLSDAFTNSGEIERALLALEVNCRDILTLFGLGNSYKDISIILEIKIGTVMSRMARCRQHLSTNLGGEHV